MKLLYVCNEDRATTKQRLLALESLNLDFEVVYTYLLSEKPSLVTKIRRKIFFKLGLYPERNNENQKILNEIKENKYDILFIEKGLSIFPATLEKVKKKWPNIILLSYLLDDVKNKSNNSIYFKESIPLYDYIFTNKKFNIDELHEMNAKKVFYFKNAFSSHFHRPVEVSGAEKDYFGSEVSFIGTYEKDRADFIRFLADKGVKIKIWGWSKSAKNTKMIHENIIIMNSHVYDLDYAKVVAASKVNLCFLRKANRDRETTRSVEIPACGGFMISERTNEQTEMFAEAIEAEYFDSREELLAKIIYYLTHETERQKIAINARAKCLTANYSYEKQLSDIIKHCVK